MTDASLGNMKKRKCGTEESSGRFSRKPKANIFCIHLSLNRLIMTSFASLEAVPSVAVVLTRCSAPGPNENINNNTRSGKTLLWNKLIDCTFPSFSSNQILALNAMTSNILFGTPHAFKSTQSTSYLKPMIISNNFAK